MRTDIDVVFDQLRDAVELYPLASPQSQHWRLPHRPLSLLLEDDIRRRARFLDSGQMGPHERWPYASPKHLIQELEELARNLRSVSGIPHTAALKRVARAAGYMSWEHARSEEEEFEACAGDTFRNGLVVAATEISGPASAFTRDDRLLFLAARDLVYEFSEMDDEGGWGQLTVPSTICGDRRPNIMATRQMFLEAVRASYWRQDNGVAIFLRYHGELPPDFESAVALVQSLIGANGLRYLWLKGKMHKIVPLWD